LEAGDFHSPADACYTLNLLNLKLNDYKTPEAAPPQIFEDWRENQWNL
jgi:hypothetical protein